MMANQPKDITRPFLKWAGGKRWFVANYGELLPSKVMNYFEPFLGGGSVFFHLLPRNGILSDLNGELIDTYRAIRADWRAVWTKLLVHHRHHSLDYYYKVRASKPRTASGWAARLIYLNRTCFNGLYRVNLKGQFNVPIGSKESVVYPNDDFAAVAAALSRIKLRTCDFSDTIACAQKGDFLYVDPPYTVKHNNNNFLKYNENIFSWQDQVRLAQCLLGAIDRGARVLVSNANHRCITHLYNSGIWNRHVVNRHCVIASDGKKRKKTTELVMTSY